MYFFLCFLGLLCVCVCSTEGCPDNCICEEYQSVCQIEQCSDDLPFEYMDFLKIKGVLCQRHKDFLKSLSPNTIIVVTDDSCAGLCNCRDDKENVPTKVTPEHNFTPFDQPEPLPEVIPPPIELPEPLPEMQPEPVPLPEIMPAPEAEHPEPLPEIMPAAEPEHPEPLPVIMPAPEPEHPEPLPEQPEPEQAEPEQPEPEEELTTKDMTTEVTTEPTILTTFYRDSEEEEDGNQSSTVSIYRGVTMDDITDDVTQPTIDVQNAEVPTDISLILYIIIGVLALMIMSIVSVVVIILWRKRRMNGYTPTPIQLHQMQDDLIEQTTRL